MFQTLRKANGVIVMDIPKTFIEQNQLREGSHVELRLLGAKMIVEASSRPRYRLSYLMAEMQKGLPDVEGWDAMPTVGLEDSL